MVSRSKYCGARSRASNEASSHPLVCVRRSFVTASRVSMWLLMVGALILAAAPASGRTRTVAPMILAPEQAEPQGGRSADDRAALREQVRARYDVVALGEGVGLVPKGRAGDVRLIELTDGTVRVNGTIVTGRELRERLGPDADLIARLSFLGPAERGALVEPTVTPPIEAPRPPEPERESEARRQRERSAMYRRGDTVKITGRLHIREDELVTGDVVMIAGSVRVDGIVRGDVVVVGGVLELGPTAEVEGETTVVAGSIRRDPGAHVSGRVNEIAIGGPDFNVPRSRVVPFWWYRPWQPVARMTRLAFTLLRLVLVGFIATLILFVAPHAIERIGTRVAADPIKSGLAGVLAQLLFVPVLVVTCVILAISIIGIPLLLLVPFAIVAALFVVVMGFTGAVVRIGDRVQGRLGSTAERPFLALWTGLVAAVGLTLAARVVGLGGGLFEGFAMVLAITGFIVEYLVWTVGLGGAILARFGSRRAAPPAVVPPTPSAPLAEPAPPPATA